MSEPYTGFDAEASLDDFSYRIPEKWGGDNQIHEIPEPSTEQIAEFWSGWAAMVNIGRVTPADAPEDETDEQRDERLAREIADGQHRSMQTLDKRRELLAALCSNSPSEDTLRQLPYRVLNTFQGYVIGKISPEASGSATTS